MERVFVIGGTGFLGYHIIQEFLSAGWEVTAIGLPSVHPPRLFPESVKMIYQDLDQASDEELLSMMRGHTALVFAAGRDDRYTPNKPAYPMFHQANVSALARILHLAKDAGIKRAVVLGSYFAHFHRLWPELKLAERHPYIRSRIEQETVAFSIPGLEVMVLELPYIFGSLPIRGWNLSGHPWLSTSVPRIFYSICRAEQLVFQPAQLDAPPWPPWSVDMPVLPIPSDRKTSPGLKCWAAWPLRISPTDRSR